MLEALFFILIFPGFLFLFAFGLFAEFVDRKLYARMQNRIGPPWFQPLADFIKLSGKEEIVPEEADPVVFKFMPVLALTSTVTALFCIPLWGQHALFSFTGDVIVVLYLLTVPTITFFLGGWYSRSVYSMIGAVRALTQLFAYEVPLFMVILASALLADTWSLSEMAVFYSKHHFYWMFNLIGFFISLIALLGKLERIPFDLPEAETEIVGGTFTEYGGRFLALIKMAINVEMVVTASLLAVVFMPFGLGLGPIIGFILYIIKVLFIISLLALSHAIFARMRLEQMINVCWKYFAPLAFLQVLINLIMKGALTR